MMNSLSRLVAGTSHVGPGSLITWKEYETIKGILIVLIVVGHNTFVVEQTAAIELRAILYNFHVSSFLLLPFLFAASRFSGPLVGDQMGRYLIPFLVFYTFASLLNALVHPDVDTTLASRLVEYLEGLIFASASEIEQSSGFRLYWFLPTLLCLVLTLALSLLISIQLDRYKRLRSLILPRRADELKRTAS